MHSDGVWFVSISGSMKHLSVLLLPPGQDACQSREFLLVPVLAVFSIQVKQTCIHCELPWVPEVFLACGGNFRCLAEGRHIFGRRPKPRAAKPREKPLARSGAFYRSR